MRLASSLASIVGLACLAACQARGRGYAPAPVPPAPSAVAAPEATLVIPENRAGPPTPAAPAAGGFVAPPVGRRSAPPPSVIDARPPTRVEVIPLDAAEQRRFEEDCAELGRRAPAAYRGGTPTTVRAALAAIGGLRHRLGGYRAGLAARGLDEEGIERQLALLGLPRLLRLEALLRDHLDGLDDGAR